MNVIESLRRWHNARQINSGKSPRGRTSPLSGGVIERAMEGHTLLTVEHVRGGEVIDTRTIENRCITDVGAAALVASSAPNTAYAFNYHDCGTGTTAEAAAQTTLITAFGGSRVAGSQSNPSSKVYQSEATITFAGAFAITEHGLFSAAAAGTLLDRSLFSAVNVASGDSIKFTFQLTMASGG